jgi:hypothetical protein
MMTKKSIFIFALLAVFASPTISFAETPADIWRAAQICAPALSHSSNPCSSNSGGQLLLIRDTRSAAAGGGKNSCWKSCFDDYNSCMDQSGKNPCVSRMKTCMAVCDQLSNRPGM